MLCQRRRNLGARGRNTMQDLKVTTVQTELHWENIPANLDMFTGLLANVGDTDLVVLPEMFSTAFSMRSDALAEPMDGSAVQWMQAQAARLNAVVAGSLIIEDNGRYFNRLVWMRPDGTHSSYDKRHLFRMMGEEAHFAPGTQRVQLEVNGWQVRPLICYDLRFPIWSRQMPDKPYDLLLYCANWPEPRINAWRTLLMARAHENQCYVAGVNRIGLDGNEVPFGGSTLIIEPKGEVISQTGPTEARVETVTLSWQHLADFREKFPVNLDADSYQID